MTLTICENRQRILDAKGHVLVTGGPGCGKTTIALRKAFTRIEEGLEPGQKVLFLSFSRDAIFRIMEAARKGLPREVRQLLDIQTFHSFCWQLVRGHGYLLGAPRDIKLLLPHDERTLRYGVTAEDSAWDAERNRLFIEEGQLAFDLFAPKALALVKGSKAIRKLIADRCPLIIVDEAQDTGTDQWSCLEAMADLVQLICLADPDQQIYDFRPDVSPERLSEIIFMLEPTHVELGGQNNRSPGVEIIQFGNDILAVTPRGSPYKGVQQLNFSPKLDSRNLAIRKAIGIIRKQVQKQTGCLPESIGFLTNWGKGVSIIARALQGGDGVPEISHRVVMDEAEVLLATRVIALCIEPVDVFWEHLATGLELLADLYRAKRTKGSIKKVSTLIKSAELARQQKLNNQANAPRALKEILERLKVESLSGNPSHDWLTVRRIFESSGVAELTHVADQVMYLMGFNRGRVISEDLAEAWLRTGTYRGARQIIESAISADQIAGSNGSLTGINVMTMHKSKGKEFDGVIIFHLGNSSPLSPRHESAPYAKSRKLLRVGVTRARHAVLLLTDASNPSSLLAGHQLMI
jgi:DNA helicase-2/ATP-dependent DNA helicase PcrA